VITWGVLTLFFTPPALYLVLRKTAAWLSSIPKTKGASYPAEISWWSVRLLSLEAWLKDDLSSQRGASAVVRYAAKS
jgi:hypothetical protein